MYPILLLANLLVSAFLTGLIWFVQVVHYPIFSRVSPENFIRFHETHTALTGRLVVLPMLLELALGLVLALSHPHWTTWLALALVVVAWLSTFFLSVPLHGQLHGGFDAEAITRLVQTNWIRCLAWTARALLLLWLVYRLL
ncbi:MAG: hypothetical protein ACFCUI_05255 [Bernardetiaceae bacterium]